MEACNVDKRDIIEDITDQIKKLTRRGIVNGAWVLLTIEEAKFILSLLNSPYGEEVKPGTTGEAGA